MTVASTVNTVNYAGAGTTGPFSIPFKFFKNADIIATHVSTAGLETVLTITTHYTLTGAGDASGGALTLVSALASGEKLYIKRSPAITQETDYVENAAFSAETHEAALDLLTMIAQDNAEKISRAVLVDISSSTTPDDLLAELASDVAAASASATDAETAKGLAEDAQAAAEAAAASIEIPVPVASGGTGATSASGARTALGLGDLATMDEADLGLGTAAYATLGTAANNALQLNASAKIASTAYDFASTATMEEGTNTTQPANAAGVAAAIDALAPDGGGVGTTINTSRSMTAATGSVDYNTSESTKTPKAAFIFYNYDANNWGWSYANGASGFLYGKLAGAEYFQWDGQVIAAQPSSGNVQRVAASAVSFSLGRVTLSWVKVGSPTGTLYLKIVPLY